MAKLEQQQQPMDNEDEVELARGTRGFVLHSTFVLKACQALLAFMKSDKHLAKLNTSGKSNLLATENNSLPIFVNFNLWVVPKRAYHGVKISNLPHDVHGDVSKRVCVIAPNKEGKTSEETVHFYKTLARSLNKVHDFDVITWRDIKPHLDSFDDKRHLARSYDLFIADASLRDFLMPKFGKIFKRAQKFPINISLQRPVELKRLLSGTHFFLHNDGNNYSYLIGHSGMTPQELRDNVVESLSQLAKVVPNGWRNIRSAGIIGKSTAFIPIYDSSDVSNFTELSSIYQQAIVKSVPLETKPTNKGHDFEDNVTNERLIIKKGNKHLTNFSKISQLKKKVLKMSAQKKKIKSDDIKDAVIVTASNKENVSADVGGVKKRKRKMKKVNGKKHDTSAEEKAAEIEIECVAAAESTELPEIDATVSVKSKRLRSTSDAAILKTEKRKMKKRLAVEMSDQEFTTREIHLLAESKKKKQKCAEIPSPKLTGYDKHLFEDSNSSVKTEKKSKLEDHLKFTGYEQYILSGVGESESAKNHEKAKKSSDEEFEIPEHFFQTQDGNTPLEQVFDIPIASVASSAKKKATPAVKRRESVAATRRSARVSSVAENTPLRRSTRINSCKK